MSRSKSTRRTPSLLRRNAIPRVTALHPERRDRVRVELDGAPWRTLPTAAVVELRLVVGTELDQPRARELRQALRRHDALAVATRTLVHRARSAASVEAALERRGVSPVVRSEALVALERAGYVDDARFATGRAGVLAERGYGDAGIRFELEREGVAAEHAEAAIDALDPEPQRAHVLVERLGRSAKTARRLLAKGFSEDAVESAVGPADESDF